MAIRMTQERARRIVRALKWPALNFRSDLNRVTRSRYSERDVSRWLAGGQRRVPADVALFLRMEVRSTIAGRNVLRALYDRLPGDFYPHQHLTGNSGLTP